MSDDILILIFLKEFACGRECDLVDVFVNLFLSHSDAAINHFKGFSSLIQFNPDLQVSCFAFEFPAGGNRLHLLRCIYGVCHDLSQEYLMV